MSQPMIMQVLCYPNEELRRTAKRVPGMSDELRVLSRGLLDTMKLTGATGLSACQVGVCVAMFQVMTKKGPALIINPEVVRTEGEPTEFGETCLSLPGTRIKVKRPPAIWLRCWNGQGEQREFRVEGLEARAVLHEMDHLSGKTILDHADAWKRELVDRKMEHRRNTFVRLPSATASDDGDGLIV